MTHSSEGAHVSRRVDTIFKAIEQRVTTSRTLCVNLPQPNSDRLYDQALRHGIGLLVDATRDHPREPIFRLAAAALTAKRPLLDRDSKLRIVMRNADCVLRQAFTAHHYRLHRDSGPDMLATVARFLKTNDQPNEALSLYELATGFRASDRTLWAEQGILMAAMRHQAQREQRVSAPIRPLIQVPQLKSQATADR